MLHHETTFVHSISALLSLGFTGTVLVLRDAFRRRARTGETEPSRPDPKHTGTADTPKPGND